MVDHPPQSENVQGLGIDYPVTLCHEEDAPRQGRIVALGPEATTIALSDPPPVGSEVSISFGVDGYPYPIEARGRIWWEGAYGRPGAGVVFEQMSSWDRSIVLDHLQWRLSELMRSLMPQDD